MKETVSKTAHKPLGRGKTGFRSGKTFSYLLALHESKAEFDKTKSIMYRNDFFNGWQQYVPRSILTPEQAAQAVAETGLTLHQLFLNSLGCPDLSAEDKYMLAALENLSKNTITTVVEFLRTLQYPWWVPILKQPIPDIDKRLQEVTRRVIGYLSADRSYSVNYPYISNYFPFSKQFFIDTDDIPFLAAELDVPYAVITELGYSVSNYTHNKFADICFTEYKLLTKSLRPIVKEYVEFLQGKGDV